MYRAVRRSAARTRRLRRKVRALCKNRRRKPYRR